MSIKIVSWNVNGIRACYKKGAFFDYLDHESPDILFLQETKVSPVDIPPELDNPKGYYSVWHSAERKGYSGVALFTRLKPLEVFEGFGNPKFDCEGRVIGARFENFICFGVYFPNGQMSDERLKYKLDFYDAFFNFANEVKANGENIIICGDYNTAHHDIDLARPKENQDVSGFLPIERAWLDKISNEYGYVDTFRQFHSQPEEYSWWTYRAGARQRNIGWRIDYVFANHEFLPLIQNGFIQQSVMGSDHCPVGVTINAS